MSEKQRARSLCICGHEQSCTHDFRDSWGEQVAGHHSGFEKYTSTKIIEAIKGNFSESRREWMVWMFERAGKGNSNNEHYQFWQQHNQPIELSDNVIIESKLNYIHENPVKAGIVLSADEYFYSSAKNYADLPERLLDVVWIE